MPWPVELFCPGFAGTETLAHATAVAQCCAAVSVVLALLSAGMLWPWHRRWRVVGAMLGLSLVHPVLWFLVSRTDCGRQLMVAGFVCALQSLALFGWVTAQWVGKKRM